MRMRLECAQHCGRAGANPLVSDIGTLCAHALRMCMLSVL